VTHHVVTDTAQEGASESVQTSGTNYDETGFLCLTHLDDTLTRSLAGFAVQLVLDLTLNVNNLYYRSNIECKQFVLQI